jgi:hypothetical protein
MICASLAEYPSSICLTDIGLLPRYNFTKVIAVHTSKRIPLSLGKTPDNHVDQSAYVKRPTTTEHLVRSTKSNHSSSTPMALKFNQCVSGFQIHGLQAWQATNSHLSTTEATRRISNFTHGLSTPATSPSSSTPRCPRTHQDRIHSRTGPTPTRNINTLP